MHLLLSSENQKVQSVPSRDLNPEVRRGNPVDAAAMRAAVHESPAQWPQEGYGIPPGGATGFSPGEGN